jgi:hypothetical protein
MVESQFGKPIQKRRFVLQKGHFIEVLVVNAGLVKLQDGLKKIRLLATYPGGVPRRESPDDPAAAAAAMCAGKYARSPPTPVEVIGYMPGFALEQE